MPRNNRRKKFLLTGKQFLLTYPKCNATKEQFRTRLLSLFDGSPTKQHPTVVVVGQEHHLDGTLHLHAALKFKETFSTHMPMFFDFLTGSHGNYTRVQSWRGTILYCVKEDTDPYLYGITKQDIERLKKKTDAVSNEVAHHCIQNKPLREIAMEYPGFFMMNRTKILSFHTWINSDCHKEMPPWPGITYRGSRSSSAAIVHWVQTNCFQDRPFKSRQLYIHGPKDCGKTSFVLMLMKYLRTYVVPQFEDFYDDYEDYFDLIFYDEFYGSQKKLQWMNLFLQGALHTLSKKGSQKLKRRNLPIIICSNFKPEDAYPRCTQALIDTFKCRLHEVELTKEEPIDYDNIFFESPTNAEQEFIRECDTSLCPFCAEYNGDCLCVDRRPPSVVADTATRTLSGLSYTFQSGRPSSSNVVSFLQ